MDMSWGYRAAGGAGDDLGGRAGDLSGGGPGCSDGAITDRQENGLRLHCAGGRIIVVKVI